MPQPSLLGLCKGWIQWALKKQSLTLPGPPLCRKPLQHTPGQLPSSDPNTVRDALFSESARTTGGGFNYGSTTSTHVVPVAFKSGNPLPPSQGLSMCAHGCVCVCPCVCVQGPMFSKVSSAPPDIVSESDSSQPSGHRDRQKDQPSTSSLQIMFWFLSTWPHLQQECAFSK